MPGNWWNPDYSYEEPQDKSNIDLLNPGLYKELVRLNANTSCNGQERGLIDQFVYQRINQLEDHGINKDRGAPR